MITVEQAWTKTYQANGPDDRWRPQKNKTKIHEFVYLSGLLRAVSNDAFSGMRRAFGAREFRIVDNPGASMKRGGNDRPEKVISSFPHFRKRG